MLFHSLPTLPWCVLVILFKFKLTTPHRNNNNNNKTTTHCTDTRADLTGKCFSPTAYVFAQIKSL